MLKRLITFAELSKEVRGKLIVERAEELAITRGGDIKELMLWVEDQFEYEDALYDEQGNLVIFSGPERKKKNG